MKQSERAAFMAMIVKLYYVDNQGQKEIAELTGISQAKASRLLAEARESGMVQIKVSKYEPTVPELEKRLTAELGLHRAIVIRTWANQQRQLRYENISYFAAPFIDKMIKPDSVICVSAGRHLAHLVKDLKRRNVPSISVLQTMGSVGATVTDYDAIEVGRKFANLYGGKFYQLQAPAIASSQQEREVFVRHPQISSVLEMMQQADLAIVSLSVPTDSVFMENKFLKAEDIERLKQENVAGEICSRFFDAGGNQPDIKYRDCVIGITLEQLKSTPEVVAITSGANRKEAIRYAAKNGFIKSLITDDTTAEAVLETE